EMHNFEVRKNLLEYDEVMDKQRKFIYSQRQDVLEKRNLREKVLGMFEHVLEPKVELCAGDEDKPVDYEELRRWLLHKVGSDLELDGLEAVQREGIFEWVMDRIAAVYDKRKEKFGDDGWE